MKKTSVVLAMSALLGGCMQQGPTDDEIMAAAQHQLDSDLCLRLDIPSEFISDLPRDRSFVLPSETVEGFTPGLQEKLAERLSLLKKEGYFTSEPATFAVSDSHTIPAVRYRLTSKGINSFSGTWWSAPCVKAGHLQALRIRPLDGNQPPIEHRTPNAVPMRATRYLDVKWVDKPDWLSTPEGELAFAKKPVGLDTALETGLRVNLVQENTGKWHSAFVSTSPDQRRPAQVMQDTEAELIHKIELKQNEDTVPHDELPLPIGLTDTRQFKTEVGTGIFIADEHPPLIQPVEAETAPSYPLRPHSISPQQRNEARELFDMLAKYGALTRKPASQVSTKLPKGWVYYLPDKIETRQPQFPRYAASLDLGPYKLGDHFTNKYKTMLLGTIPFTLANPPTWLREAAKNSAYFTEISRGGTLSVAGTIINGQYHPSIVRVEDSNPHSYYSVY